MDLFQSSNDFSDDSLMVTGPALTDADRESSITKLDELKSPSQATLVEVGQVDSNVSNGRRIGQSPALIDAQAYADCLTREILDDTNQLVRSKTEQQQSSKESQALENTHDTSTHDSEEPEDKPGPDKLIDLDVSLRGDEKETPPEADANIRDYEDGSHEDNQPGGVAHDVDTAAAAPTGTSDEESQKAGSMDLSSGSNSDIASREESHWEYKSVLKETAVADSGDREASSPVKLQRDITSLDSEVAFKTETAMEFTKNYSDDLLMGQTDGGQAQGESHTTSADLADFELPPYSGSSSGSSEPAARQQSPTIKAQSSTPSTSSQLVGSCSPSLTALRDLLKSNYSRVSHIFHWKKPIESGACFAIGVTLIIALTFFSIISVVAYSALGLMLASGSIRLYKTVMKTLNRSTELPSDHIWNKLQALNVAMSHEKVHDLVDSSLGSFNASLVYFKQVLLVQDKVATLKFGVFVYFLTYIGAWFNGMTLITIGYLGLFLVPILYEKNKTKIDELANLATGHLCSATSMITSKVGSLVSGSSASAAKKHE